MKIRGGKDKEKNELNMTSMIDIVFLLLIFFVMTFKIVEQEGDFSVRMPLAGGAGAADITDLPLKLRLRADGDGKLTGMALNEIDLGVDFDKLRGNVVSLIGSTAPAGDDGDGPELEIDTDYQLRYQYVIEAITAVSGYKDGDQVVKLIEKIKFAKPRR
ncbi:Biopolymer transport protein ExbD/TolR [Rubripirellula amarantea]|uniref:Biopolymer transport protein ExbD/TolR n=1 Tax=Rubripirellula amarantea TaxID=2527999 RepID=A0A5C5WR14_9BACT|nr:biopolymer transporter ExbD [Rubripirellula amarantea]TWT52483.1 Biopolymer transport protein ExbD/TolR [Rubripirellula amarantea]